MDSHLQKLEKIIEKLHYTVRSITKENAVYKKRVEDQEIRIKKIGEKLL